MKGLGTNDEKLINALGPLSSADMAAVRQKFGELFQRDLIHDITSETSGHYRQALVQLCTDPAELDAELVREAVKGIGTNETELTEIICTRSPAELKAMCDAYERKYQRNLEGDVKSDTGGDLRKVYCACLAANRGSRQQNVDADVEALHKAGPGKIGTNEQAFIDIIGGSTRQHVDAIYWAYAKKYGKSLDAMIRDEMSGDLGKALASLSQPGHVYFAERILHCMKGLGTSDQHLIRLIVTQRERYLREAGKYFLEVNRKTISAWVESETSANYKRILLKICQTAGA